LDSLNLFNQISFLYLKEEQKAENGAVFLEIEDKIFGLDF